MANRYQDWSRTYLDATTMVTGVALALLALMGARSILNVERRTSELLTKMDKNSQKMRVQKVALTGRIALGEYASLEPTRCNCTGHYETAASPPLSQTFNVSSSKRHCFSMTYRTVRERDIGCGVEDEFVKDPPPSETPEPS